MYKRTFEVSPSITLHTYGLASERIVTDCISFSGKNRNTEMNLLFRFHWESERVCVWLPKQGIFHSLWLCDEIWTNEIYTLSTKATFSLNHHLLFWARRLSSMAMAMAMRSHVFPLFFDFFWVPLSVRNFMCNASPPFKLECHRFNSGIRCELLMCIRVRLFMYAVYHRKPNIWFGHHSNEIISFTVLGSVIFFPAIEW